MVAGRVTLSDRALVVEMRRFKGLPWTARMLGLAIVYGSAGCDSVEAIRRCPIGSVGARYHFAAELELLALHLKGVGYDLGVPESADELVPRLGRIHAGTIAGAL